MAFLWSHCISLIYNPQTLPGSLARAVPHSSFNPSPPRADPASNSELQLCPLYFPTPIFPIRSLCPSLALNTFHRQILNCLFFTMELSSLLNHSQFKLIKISLSSYQQSHKGKGKVTLRCARTWSLLQKAQSHHCSHPPASHGKAEFPPCHHCLSLIHFHCVSCLNSRGLRSSGAAHMRPASLPGPALHV